MAAQLNAVRVALFVVAGGGASVVRWCGYRLTGAFVEYTWSRGDQPYFWQRGGDGFQSMLSIFDKCIFTGKCGRREFGSRCVCIPDRRCPWIADRRSSCMRSWKQMRNHGCRCYTYLVRTVPFTSALNLHNVQQHVSWFIGRELILQISPFTIKERAILRNGVAYWTSWMYI